MSDAIKVLVVDDDRVDRLAIVRGLAAIDPELEIIEADDGNTAFSMLKRYAIDVLITDYNMPMHNGLDICCVCNELNCDIITYIVTGFLGKKLTKHYSRNRYITNCYMKPVDTEELYRDIIKDLKNRKKSKDAE